VSFALVIPALLAAQLLELPPPPEGLDLDPRKRLTPEDYARKNEDWYFTGLPLANYDSNSGFGAGARAYYFFNGARTDGLFAYTPYLHRVFLQGFATTGGVQFHWLDWDAPYLLGTPLRARAQLIYERNLARHYFGADGRALGALTSPADGVHYDSMADYDATLRRIGDDGVTYARYDEVDMQRPILFLSLERTFLSGTVRPLFGFTFSRVILDDYSGERVDVDGAPAVMGKSRLQEDREAGRVVGAGGGWDNMLRLGLSYDTRDFEPDPNSGVFVDLALDAGTFVLGSDFDYVRLLLSGRVYWSPFPDVADLVLCARGAYQYQTDGTPFFSMNLMSFTEDPRAGLGGLRTMRGYKQDRFIGHVMAVVNLEARWTFGHAELLGQKFAFLLAPFLDSGRVFRDLAATSYHRWQTSLGGALRIAWNQATIVSIDYGVSPEDAGLFVNFNHIF
jgi:hypothetical protein